MINMYCCLYICDMAVWHNVHYTSAALDLLAQAPQGVNGSVREVAILDGS